MRRVLFFIAIFLFTLSSVMGQMIPINLPADGNWPTIVGDSIMIIGPRQNELTEEQRYFNPIYLMTYPGKEHLKAQMIRAGACDCDPTIPNRRIGVFSVAPDKQVSFSQGNLQYLPAINLWKFADTQYEYLGNANKYLKPTFRNWVDLFGWSANNTTAPFGVSTSTNVADYAGEFVDWGTNTICGEAPNTWRTLSADEWEYLLNGRENAQQLRTKGSVEGKEGVILLPDSWICPEGYTIAIIPDEANLQPNVNTYSQADWSKLEDAGAIILPSAGMRRNAIEVEVRHPNIFGGYWTCTNKDEHNSYCYTFHTQDCEYMDYSNHIYGRSVRLVHDTIVPKPEPEYVDLGLSVKWATFNVGATSPEDYGDYFAWGETEPKETYSWATYKWCDGTDANITKYNTADGKTILEPADDAAQVQWGGKWRMPTEEEQQELIDRCSWERTNLNGVIGYKVTGPNGNSIFIPIAGAYNSFDNQLNSVGSIGWIYSSTKATGTRAYEIHIEEGVIQQKDCSRCVGLTIRPVYDDRPPKRIGVFSVAADKQVSFSQGNLQYTQSTDEWRFAREQYEYIGAENVKNGQLADRIDLFGWSSNSGKAPFGISTSTNAADYVGEFVDWGVNTISGDASGTWRTLSIEEWKYLFENRANAAQLNGVAQVVGENGMIILPDDWVAPDGITFQPGFHKNDLAFAQHQTFTEQQWLLMETAGAIFLPAAGIVYNSNIRSPREGAHYQSSDTDSINTNYWIGFRSSYYTIQNSEACVRRSVRLVHDTIVSKVEPEYVDLGLSVKWATFNVGATSPEDYGDYFAWGETETKDKYSWATYKWCDGTSTNMTKYNTEDGKTILEPADDAAQVHWGGKWRMPSKEEVDELTQQCNWIWTTHNNVNGYKVTGPNGNSIFLPTAGYKGSGPTYPAGEDGLYWTNTIEKRHYSYLIVLHNDAPPTQASTKGTRCFGFTIRPVYDDRPTLTVIPTPEDAKVTFLCIGYQAVGHSITVDKGKDVLYQVTNVDAGYLSQGDSIYKLTKDSVLYVTLRPFSDGNWVVVDNSELTKYENYYISRNGGGFAGPYSNWDYYVLPVMAGETYRVRAVAGQLAPVWFAASTAPDLATKTRPKKVSCSDNKGVVAYVADEVTIPEGAKYLIINNRRGQAITVERKVPDPCLVVKVNDTLSINLMCVEGGTFMMGSNDSSAPSNTRPAHPVTLSDFHIGQTEVTQHLWKAVMGSGNNPSATKGNNLPVTNITWNEAQTFVERLSELTGLRFRLPTEAEWEYAARGGQKSKGYTYAGSNDIDQVGWYNGNSSNKTHAVGQKQPNELGIYDMTGNVWEYCYDWHTPYAAQAQTNPTGAATGDKHVLRGGCYHYDPKNCTNTNRHSYYTPDKGGASTGLRIVLEP